MAPGPGALRRSHRLAWTLPMAGCSPAAAPIKAQRRGYQQREVITTIPIGAGVDAVIYDVADKLIFVSNGDATATIIRQESPICIPSSRP